MTARRSGRRSVGVVAAAAVLAACSATGGDEPSGAASTAAAGEAPASRAPLVATPREAASSDDDATTDEAPERLPAAELVLAEADETTADVEGGAPSDDPLLARLPDLSGQVVTVLTGEPPTSAETFAAALEPFERATGAEVVLDVSSNDVARLRERLDTDHAPDVIVVAQPGRLLDLAGMGVVRPVPDVVAEVARRDYAPMWSDLVTAEGAVHGVATRVAVKSLVWYSPAAFEQAGLVVPTTWEELDQLAAAARANGTTPWCIGISAGDATGWPFTDWVEDAVLRLHDVEVYDAWVRNDVGFDDPRIAEAVDLVGDVWFTPGNVVGGRAAIAATPFAESALQLLDGECLMHRQASFIAEEYREAGAEIGADGDVDVFPLPPVEGDALPVLAAGTYAAQLADSEASSALVAWLAAPGFAEARAAASDGGFVSPNLTVDPAVYTTEIDREVAEILARADPVRFDASDLMPATVGSDAWWRAATVYTTGAITRDDLLDRATASWQAVRATEAQ